MTFGGITNALRGLGGEFEINRVVGAFGTVVYVIGANVFLFPSRSNGQNGALSARFAMDRRNRRRLTTNHTITPSLTGLVTKATRCDIATSTSSPII
jgi:hypothetical protein